MVVGAMLDPFLVTVVVTLVVVFVVFVNIGVWQIASHVSVTSCTGGNWLANPRTDIILSGGHAATAERSDGAGKPAIYENLSNLRSDSPKVTWRFLGKFVRKNFAELSKTNSPSAVPHTMERQDSKLSSVDAAAVASLAAKANIWASIKYDTFAALITESVPSDLPPARTVDTFLCLQRGSPDLPYLRLFWKQGDIWCQKVPFIFDFTVGKRTIAQNLTSLQCVGDKVAYLFAGGAFRARRVNEHQYVFTRIME
ncbi:hypothetical protein BC830DRAFT_1085082 [Chytriomyces sp. MP71]|nr:hypothetical protein BC830DRAFT_1085082 [Chytriomyces sp. MP71]